MLIKHKPKLSNLEDSEGLELGRPVKRLKCKIMSPFDLLKDDKTLSKEEALGEEEKKRLAEAKRQRLEREKMIS